MNKTWWKDSVVYQIYPRSFQDSNNDGIGDLQGIISRLDYIKKLGADVIWLCPVYKSPNYDNGYDISDYKAILSDFGTMEDFDELLKQAHSRDIKIIMDLVVNHTSIEHQWFIESQKSKDNPYRDYYIWKEGKDNKEPNELESVFEGSAWQYDPQTNMYFLHLYTDKQPDLNWENEKVRQEVYDLMTWWFEKGIDGFRMDVINQISKDYPLMDQYKKGKDNLGKTISNGPRVHEFLKEMNAKVLSKYNPMTVGETGSVTVEDAKKYAGFNENELSMIFQFEHMSLDKGDMSKLEVIRPDLSQLRTILSRWQTELYGKAWNSLFFENHDRPRSVSKYGDDSTAFYREKSAKMLATMYLMMQGTPYIYQGQELGMTNIYFTSIDQYDDVDTINKYNKWKDIYTNEQIMHYFGKRSRDNARTPMQWDDSYNAGFTSGTPWLEINPNYKEINAKQQVNDPDSIFNYYVKMIEIRKQYPTIIHGTYELLLENHPQVFSYLRQYNNQKILVICNYFKDEITLDKDFISNNATLLAGNYHDDLKETLRAYEAKVYLL